MRACNQTLNAILRLISLAVLILLWATPARVLAFCHEFEVVQSGIFRAAASPAPPLTLEWMGHSTFQITSSKGTRILTDPHGAFDLPRPTLPQHIVTTSHQHGPHNSVHMAPGTPVILHGLTSTGENWQKISTTIRDVSVYAVPAFHDKSQGMQRGKNAIFVFRVDDICIAHLGDLGHILTPDQLKMMGKIDILLVPIAGGYFTVTRYRSARSHQASKSQDRHPHALLVGASGPGVRARNGESKNAQHAGAENLQSGTPDADGSR